MYEDKNAGLKFEGGKNIAMKVPPHQFDSTVSFYRDVLGLEVIERHLPSVVFAFGDNNLWIDSVAGLSQSEIWLEIITSDIEIASEHLDVSNIIRCDEIEQLPDGFDAFWISGPASIIHLVCGENNR